MHVHPNVSPIYLPGLISPHAKICDLVKTNTKAYYKTKQFKVHFSKIKVKCLLLGGPLKDIAQKFGCKENDVQKLRLHSTDKLIRKKNLQSIGFPRRPHSV